MMGVSATVEGIELVLVFADVTCVGGVIHITPETRLAPRKSVMLKSGGIEMAVDLEHRDVRQWLGGVHVALEHIPGGALLYMTAGSAKHAHQGDVSLLTVMHQAEIELWQPLVAGGALQVAVEFGEG